MGTRPPDSYPFRGSDQVPTIVYTQLDLIPPLDGPSIPLGFGDLLIVAPEYPRDRATDAACDYR
jgi:hypothetical protein